MRTPGRHCQLLVEIPCCTINFGRSKMIHKQPFQSENRWKHTANLTRPILSPPLPRQPMPEGVTLPSPDEVKIRPSFRDLESNIAVRCLYYRWCLDYNIRRKPGRGEKGTRKFRVFKKNAIQVFLMNQTDPSCQFHLSSFCDDKDLFDLEEFCHLRLGDELYVKRKNYFVDNLKMEVIKLENKLRFIRAVIVGEFEFFDRSNAEMASQLRKMGFTPFPKNSKSLCGVGDAEETRNSSERAETQNEQENSDYDYLLYMPIGSATIDKVQELHAERDKRNQELEEMKAVDPKHLWVKDLDKLEQALDARGSSDALKSDSRSSQAGYKASRKTNKKTKPAPKTVRSKLAIQISMATAAEPMDI